MQVTVRRIPETHPPSACSLTRDDTDGGSQTQRPARSVGNLPATGSDDGREHVSVRTPPKSPFFAEIAGPISDHPMMPVVAVHEPMAEERDVGRVPVMLPALLVEDVHAVACADDIAPRKATKSESANSSGLSDAHDTHKPENTTTTESQCRHMHHASGM